MHEKTVTVQGTQGVSAARGKPAGGSEVLDLAHRAAIHSRQHIGKICRKRYAQSSARFYDGQNRRDFRTPHRQMVSPDAYHI